MTAKFDKFPYVMALVLWLYIFALSISRWNAVYSICFALLVIVMGYAAIKKRTIYALKFPDKAFNIVYWPFFICLLVSSLILGDYPSIISSVNFFYWSVPFIILFIACQFTKIDKKDELIVSALTAALWITSGKAIHQYITADEIIRVTGFFGGPNDLATMLCLNMSFLFCITIGKRNILSKWTTYASFGAFAAGLVAFMLTGSRAGMIAILSGAVATWLLYVHAVKLKITGRKKAALIGSLVIVVVFFIGGMLVTQNRQIRQHYDAERIRLVMSAYEMWDDHKLLGVGLKNWGREYHAHYIRPDAREPNLDIPHNVPAYFFSSAGTAAGIAYLWYALGICWYMYREIKKYPSNPYVIGFLWAAVAVFVHGAVDSGITTNNVLRLYSGLLGITMAALVQNDAGENHE